MTDNIEQRDEKLLREVDHLLAFAELHGYTVDTSINLDTLRAIAAALRGQQDQVFAADYESARHMNALYHRIENQRLTIERFQHSAHGADEPVAWLADDGSNRVIDAKAKAYGRRAGGASGSATAIYSIPLYTRPQPESVSLPPIDRNESYERDYIQLPGGWEVQTKGKGSTFRLCDTKTGDRLPMGYGGGKHEHDMLERMAREIHAAVSVGVTSDADTRDAERYRWLRNCDSEQEDAVLVRGEKGWRADELLGGDSLDAAIDAAIAAAMDARGGAA